MDSNSTKLKDLLAEPNWNHYEAFQPVDGVKDTNEEIRF